MKMMALVLALGASQPAQPALHRHWHHHHYAHHGIAFPVLEAQLFKPPRSNPRTPVAAAVPAPGVIAQLQSMLATWQAADAIAIGGDPAHPLDPQGHACYGAMVAFLGALPSGATPMPIGSSAPILEAARARVGRTQVPTIAPGIGEVRGYCAAIVAESDAQFLSRLAAGAQVSVAPADLIKAGVAQ
jgi:hypothetical protein